MFRYGVTFPPTSLSGGDTGFLPSYLKLPSIVRDGRSLRHRWFIGTCKKGCTFFLSEKRGLPGGSQRKTVTLTQFLVVDNSLRTKTSKLDLH